MNEEVERFCPECGYNLRGLNGGRCPECGVEVLGEYVSPIAWEHRGTIGGWKGFWRTLVMVTFHPDRAARAVGGPVDGGAARKFRWIVTGLFMFSVLWLHLAFGVEHGLLPRAWRGELPRRIMSEVGSKGIGWWSEVRLIWAAGGMSPWVDIVGVVIAAAGVCWCPRNLFMLNGLDEVRRERLESLCAYSVAPLGWAPVLALLCVARDGLAKGSDLKTPLETWVLTALTGLAIGVGALTLGSAWLAPVRIRWRAANEGLGGAMISGVAGLPAGIAAGFVIGLVVVPAIAGLVIVAIESLN